jgi:hypothetical protein
MNLAVFARRLLVWAYMCVYVYVHVCVPYSLLEFSLDIAGRIFFFYLWRRTCALRCSRRASARSTASLRLAANAAISALFSAWLRLCAASLGAGRRLRVRAALSAQVHGCACERCAMRARMSVCARRRTHTHVVYAGNTPVHTHA